MTFYFPIPFLAIDPALDDVTSLSRFSIVRRKWEVSEFDLATLEINHKLHISRHLIGVYLQGCNFEISVDADDLREALKHVNSLRLGLLLNGVRPSFLPLAANVSLNRYAGINSRDSNLLRDKLPDGLREGITSKGDTVVEVWPVELTLILTRPVDLGVSTISRDLFSKAVEDSLAWSSLKTSTSQLQVIEDTLLTGPLLRTPSQSLLHLWTGIEALFESVHSEVSFRVSLLLAQLIVTRPDRNATYTQVKSLYRKRSAIAHGGATKVRPEDWQDVWSLLIDTCRSIIHRGCLPSEDKLFQEMLGPTAPLPSAPPGSNT